MIKLNDGYIAPNAPNEDLYAAFEQEHNNAKEWVENQVAIHSLAPDITDVSLNNRAETYTLWLVTMQQPGTDEKDRSTVCFTAKPDCTFQEACEMLKGIHTPEGVESLSIVGKAEVHRINLKLNGV